MVQVSNTKKIDRVAMWTLAVSRVIIAAAALTAALVMMRAFGEIEAQREERDCRFDLTTETDKVDSDIAVKQAQIFEAVILRPPDVQGTRTEEMVRLGNELHSLIEARTIAYEQRANAVQRCS